MEPHERKKQKKHHLPIILPNWLKSLPTVTKLKCVFLHKFIITMGLNAIILQQRQNVNSSKKNIIEVYLI